ncbi:hypothetical protein WN51_04473 [Melipona quadrifasciata]|uniref:Uncharacterized protein n=1 Tax=Melipona quadrifasciata TaxID=166423 RepID=A0A0N0U3J3_9HYME|nr:hypothetical protein WN51_04473 [Melipona quadrifasciata]
MGHFGKNSFHKEVERGGHDKNIARQTINSTQTHLQLPGFASNELMGSTTHSHRAKMLCTTNVHYYVNT